MIFDPLRRALVRWLNPPATSVSPQIAVEAPLPEPEPIGPIMVRRGVVRLMPGESVDEAIQRYLKDGGRLEDVPGWDDNTALAPAIPNRRLEEPRPGIKPPPDPALDGWTWTKWKREIDAGSLPGWAVCRFANRIGPDEVGFVFGIVRGSFGIWRQPFDVCASGADRTQHILTCVTHLRSGLGIGIFSDREVAAQAAALADRVSPAWETLDPDDRATWDDAQSRTLGAWLGIGVRHADDAHCHDQHGSSYPIYVQTQASMMEGRPEKLS